MKEHPIIFSTDMVKVILEGRKAQTRRVVRHPEKYDNIRDCDFCCPYGQVGDKLWVRETLRRSKVGIPTRYSADDCPVFRDGETPNEWLFRTQVVPSIFMPRWASRITLEITEVRVERVQEITYGDCMKEGLDMSHIDYRPSWDVSKFKSLWDSLNAKRGYGWDANPWVWVISFKEMPE